MSILPMLRAVPRHPRDISRKDLASILRQAKLSVDQFLKLLRGK